MGYFSKSVVLGPLLGPAAINRKTAILTICAYHRDGILYQQALYHLAGTPLHRAVRQATQSIILVVRPGSSNWKW
jgi:hypothetical protein